MWRIPSVVRFAVSRYTSSGFASRRRLRGASATSGSGRTLGPHSTGLKLRPPKNEAFLSWDHYETLKENVGIIYLLSPIFLY